MKIDSVTDTDDDTLHSQLKAHAYYMRKELSNSGVRATLNRFKPSEAQPDSTQREAAE